jgi:hypothetical protein
VAPIHDLTDWDARSRPVEMDTLLSHYSYCVQSISRKVKLLLNVHLELTPAGHLYIALFCLVLVPQQQQQQQQQQHPRRRRRRPRRHQQPALSSQEPLNQRTYHADDFVLAPVVVVIMQ